MSTEVPPPAPINAPEAVRGIVSAAQDSAPGTVVMADPTQVRRPWRATLRTIVQVGIPAIIGLGLVVPQVVQAILEETSKRNIVIPDNLRLVLLGISAGVVAVAAILTRIMAIPQVEVLLRKIGLGAAPKS